MTLFATPNGDIDLVIGKDYKYVYRTGEYIYFQFEGLVKSLMNEDTLTGIVYHSSRRTILAQLAPQSIIKLTSIEPTRFQQYIPNSHGKVIQTGSSPGSSSCCTAHDPVDVGFIHSRLVCRKCDQDLGSVPLKKAGS